MKEIVSIADMEETVVNADEAVKQMAALTLAMRVNINAMGALNRGVKAMEGGEKNHALSSIAVILCGDPGYGGRSDFKIAIDKSERLVTARIRLHEALLTYLTEVNALMYGDLQLLKDKV